MSLLIYPSHRSLYNYLSRVGIELTTSMNGDTLILEEGHKLFFTEITVYHAKPREIITDRITVYYVKPREIITNKVYPL